MTRTRLFILSSMLLGVGASVWSSGPAHAWCYPFKCCDQWGYDYPGFYETNNGCEDAGGHVECGVFWCSNQSILPWRCCDTDGAEVPGFYMERHDCAAAGLMVVNLYPGDSPVCPNAAPFKCCDPAGGDAPGTYAYRSTCVDAGYVVHDDPACPGGWLEDVQDFFTSLVRGPQCPLAVNHHYNKPASDSIMKDWKQEHAGEFAGPWDKYTHCITSCLITVECGASAAALVGWMREGWQMCGWDVEDNPNSEDYGTEVQGNGWGSGDECANQYGRDYGQSLSAQFASQAEDECVDYCIGLDFPTLCVPDQSLVQLGLEVAESLVPETIFGLENPFAAAWSSFLHECDDGLLSPLTYPDGAAELADILHEVSLQGASLLDAAAVLTVGQSGVFAGGTVAQRLGDDEYAFFIQMPAAQVDAHLGFSAGKLTSLRFRGADGDAMTMSAAEPIATACANPPCERRVAWTQWQLSREPVDAVPTPVLP